MKKINFQLMIQAQIEATITVDSTRQGHYR